MFEPLPGKLDFPASEERVLEFWQREGIFARSLAQRAAAPRFEFYEGPPTANGLPHPGHCLTRAMKDLFPRYRTMCGFLVERKAGWDTHGLPVEREVCRELGIHTKQEIEKYGIEPFVRKCLESVFRYTREWEELTRRLGFWVNLDEAYVTYHQSYVESVWWSLKVLFERGLLYQGHKVVWWWAQGGTALSSGEVGEGYREVDDPSVFVKFPLVQKGSGSGDRGSAGPALPANTSLLVWTTTPWTLISNHFAAVHPELEYAIVADPGDGHHPGEHLVVAAALVEALSKKVKREWKVVGTCTGRDLIGLHYKPPFDGYYEHLHGRGEVIFGLGVALETLMGRAPHRKLGDLEAELVEGGTASIGWRVLAADFVTIESGTGLVHEAPAFGEVDFNLLQQERRRFRDPAAIPVLCAVAPDGTFNSDAPQKYRGRWVKDCDKEIIRELKERTTPWGTPLLLHQEQIRHDYPFCPQADSDPLIQYARKSWFVKTSQFKDEFLKNNAAINWLPEHIREGRFGDFLRNNVDWALSRERYWGTPLPIWVCEKTGRMEAIGSFAELQAKPGATDGGLWERKQAEALRAGAPLSEHLRVHKPYIDEWHYDSPFAKGARMRRVPEVIDCWWDAGSMPFAQWGFPHAPGSRERFAARFPADFISEAIDQTRGWFYALLAIATILEQTGAFAAAGAGTALAAQRAAYPVPYRACIVLGLIAGEDGKKMSKKLKNYREPGYIFSTYGADAMRWYFFSGQTPWTSVRFQEAAIRDAHREFLVKLYSVLSFFTIYASIDGFDPRRRDEPGNPMGFRPAAERSELDRWIITELRRTVVTVRGAMDRYENYPAAQALGDFVEALSNWYVRRSRDRFWRPFERSASAPGGAGWPAADQDKWDAYHTLYGCLRVFSRLIAPFTPFFAETMHQTLRLPGDPESVHLCDYPAPEEILYSNDTLSDEMNIVREIASLGRAARAASSVREAKRVRQPLARCEVVLARPEHMSWLEAHRGLIAEELNVRQVEFIDRADQYVTYKVVPNFAAIGKKYRTLVPGIKATLAALENPAAARETLAATGRLPLTIDGQAIELSPGEVEIRLEARPGWSAAPGRAGVVVLNTEITAELRDEGTIRELIHHVQGLRKDMDLPYQARLRLGVQGDAALRALVERYADTLRSECLIGRLEFEPVPGAAPHALDLDGVPVTLTAVAM